MKIENHQGHTEEPTHRTAEERRDEIVDHRLGRGLAGMGASFLTGAGVMFVDKPTGKWMIAASLVLLAGSGYYILRTVLRKRRPRRDA